MKRLLVLFCASALAACGSSEGDQDAGPDAGADAFQLDGDLPSDGGADVRPDTTVPTPDAGPDMGPETCMDRTVPALTTESVGFFDRPVYVTAAPDDPDRLYVVEQRGTIRIVQDGAILDTPFLTVGELSRGNEEGLLGLAFHPDYASNGRFFVYSTPRRPSRNAIDEYARSGDPMVASPEPVARLFEVEDRAPNHNGGALQFGLDRLLYAGIGDEGAADDSFDNGLTTTTPFGSILRFDVDNVAGGYAAAGNAFEAGGGLPIIWAYGLRNPWRFSFDRATGNLYIGDVGQNLWEEIDVIAPGTVGANLGWHAYEGMFVFDDSRVADVPDHHEPILVLGHREDYDDRPSRGISITGGYVYRGSAIPGLQGFYLYADFLASPVSALEYCGGEATNMQRIPGLADLGNVSSFGEDGHGELYIVTLGGGVLRVIAE